MWRPWVGSGCRVKGGCLPRAVLLLVFLVSNVTQVSMCTDRRLVFPGFWGGSQRRFMRRISICVCTVLSLVSAQRVLNKKAWGIGQLGLELRKGSVEIYSSQWISAGSETQVLKMVKTHTQEVLVYFSGGVNEKIFCRKVGMCLKIEWLLSEKLITCHWDRNWGIVSTLI